MAIDSDNIKKHYYLRSSYTTALEREIRFVNDHTSIKKKTIINIKKATSYLQCIAQQQIKTYLRNTHEKKKRKQLKNATGVYVIERNRCKCSNRRYIFVHCNFCIMFFYAFFSAPNSKHAFSGNDLIE